ncbi:MAG: TolC family protein [bacterium]|nr:TolC family protein [bacterium]
MPNRSPLAVPFLLLLALPAAAAPADCPLPAAALDLAGVVAQALCRNPDTHSAWLNVQAQQARVTLAKSAYYPTLDAAATQAHALGDSAGTDKTSAQLSANWLLYDFGARSANRRQAEQVLAALQASQENTTQSVMRQAVDAYYAWHAADEALTAAHSSEDAAKETLRAAETRQRVGAGTLADVLQARTSLSQASLAVIQRDGTREIARGTVAQALGLASPSAITLAAPSQQLPADLAPPAYEALAAALPDRRPDLRAQKLSVEAARAAQDNVDAQGRPTLSAFASDGLSRTQSASGNVEAGSVGVTLAVPLFAGGRYRAQSVVAARQLDLAEADYERQKIAASNELWTAWQSVRTAAASIGASHDLVASASEAHRAALARYRAGLGSLIEVLTAQSTLADARQQEAAARFNWHRARVALIKSSGVLNATVLATETESPLRREPAAAAPVTEAQP